MLQAFLEERLQQVGRHVLLIDLFHHFVDEALFAMRVPRGLKRLRGMRAEAQREPDAVLHVVEAAADTEPDLAARPAAHGKDAARHLALLVIADELLSAFPVHEGFLFGCGRSGSGGTMRASFWFRR